MNARYWAIIPAAGIGQRMSSEVPKQYLPLHDKPVIEHAIGCLLDISQIERIIVAIHSEDQHWSKLALAKNPKISTVYGGAERYHSVLNALHHLVATAAPMDWILVHDAARPCLQSSDVRKLINQVGDHPIGGILGTKVRDTVKRVANTGEIISTVDRADLWQAYTPQMFRFAALREALEGAIAKNQCITDEASAFELLGTQPLMIEGLSTNIKITQPADLQLAEVYLCHSSN